MLDWLSSSGMFGCEIHLFLSGYERYVRVQGGALSVLDRLLGRQTRVEHSHIKYLLLITVGSNLWSLVTPFACVQPVFLTKAQRQNLALKRRQEESVEQLKRYVWGEVEDSEPKASCQILGNFRCCEEVGPHSKVGLFGICSLLHLSSCQWCAYRMCWGGRTHLTTLYVGLSMPNLKYQ
jgi:hypothetical protein